LKPPISGSEILSGSACQTKELKAWSCSPVLGFGVRVRGVIVEDNVNDSAGRDIPFQDVEEVDEFLMPVTLHVLPHTIQTRTGFYNGKISSASSALPKTPERHLIKSIFNYKNYFV